jgi:HAD superfamily hydrolase (TIGR01549 family)
MARQSLNSRGLQVLQGLWPNVSVVIFDVEGTLVDAVPLTLRCWQETLTEYGYPVPKSVLQCLSGMDGHDMLARITPGLSRKARERIIETHGDSFKRAYLKLVQPLRGASSLLREIKRDGRKIGIATDCSHSELGHYLRTAGVTRLVDRAACGDDARRGKPHADLLELALARLRVKPSASLFVGDTPSDAEAARKVGVPAIGLLTGGFRRCDLKAAGCRAVFDDLASLGRALKSA